MRILFGLERLPRTLAADDPRLPSVLVGDAPLRLNTEPIPPAYWGHGEDHAARWSALHTWLLASCGDYNVALRRAVGRYLDAVSAHVEQHRAELAAGLAVYAGLYRVEDWCWSALRPLPRAWWQEGGEWRHADLAFWDGARVIGLEAGVLPEFWLGQTLPVSPFRRTIPSLRTQ
jgi:hypothetical protein